MASNQVDMFPHFNLKMCFPWILEIIQNIICFVLILGFGVRMLLNSMLAVGRSRVSLLFVWPLVVGAVADQPTGMFPTETLVMN